jgi:hypothetical protein
MVDLPLTTQDKPSNASVNGSIFSHFFVLISNISTAFTGFWPSPTPPITTILFPIMAAAEDALAVGRFILLV